MPVVGLIRHCTGTVRPGRYTHRSRCERHPVAVERSQISHPLRQAVLSESGRVGREVSVGGGIIRGVPASDPPSREEPRTPAVPGEGAYYHDTASVLVVSQHVPHPCGVAPTVVREREHDLVLL